MGQDSVYGVLSRWRGVTFLFDECGELAKEAVSAEPQGGLAHHNRIKATPVKSLKRINHRFGGVLFKQKPRHRGFDNFSGTAAAEGDYGPAAGQRFPHDDSKVFFSGKYEGRALLHGLR